MAATVQTTRESKKQNKKKSLSKQSMDEFLSGDWDTDTDADDLSSEASFGQSSPKLQLQKKAKSQAPANTKKNTTPKENKGKTENKTINPKENPTKTSSSKGKKENTAVTTKEKNTKKSASKGKGMKETLEDLKNTDPEFYKFLQEEDQDLLEDDSDDEDNDSDEQDSDEGAEDIAKDSGKKKKKKPDAALEKEILNMSSGSDESDDEGGGIYQPPHKLQVASDDEESDDSSDEDESDDEGQTERKQKRKSAKLITSALVKEWTQQLQSSPTVETVRSVADALAAASQQAGMAGEVSTPYRVEGSKMFNAVVRMCLTEVVPALETLLKVKSLSEQPQPFSHKNRKWKAMKGTLKNYCTLMLQLCGEVSESAMVNVILRHIHKLIVCYAALPKLSKVLLKRLVAMWSGGEETGRVLAFLCLNKLVRLQTDVFLEPALKQMYMAYVNNSKFVSPTTLPLISFMQRSLVEVMMVGEGVAYQHAFLYIRQLAIHLRNAITLKKEEATQAVYNWQFVLSLGLWSQLLSTAHASPTLQPLVYPLTQVIIGTIRLRPTPRYYPLRFHCVRYLTQLSGATNTYIPVLSFLIEVFETTDFNKRLKSSGLKNLSVSTILRFSKPQLQDKAFKETVMDTLCELLWDYLHTQSHTAAFPEMIVPLVLQLKDFAKKCKVASFCKQVKDVLSKAEDNAKVIEAKRRACTFNLADSKSVEMWECKMKEEGTPLSKFYTSWRKLRDRQLQKDIAGKEEQKLSAAESIPTLTLRRGPHRATEDEREEFAGLFGDSDSEGEEEEDSKRFLSKEEKLNRKQGVELDSDEEDYSDFDSDDLEQLAKSASEDDDDDDDDEDDDEDDDDVSDESEDESAEVKGKGMKRKMEKNSKKPTQPKRSKVELENDTGDIVQDFDMSDFDSD